MSKNTFQKSLPKTPFIILPPFSKNKRRGNFRSAVTRQWGTLIFKRNDAICGIIYGMIVESSISGNITPEQPHLSPQDVELAVKAMRGISDIEAGRCATVADVRARVLSRYAPARACV